MLVPLISVSSPNKPHLSFSRDSCILTGLDEKPKERFAYVYAEYRSHVREVAVCIESE
jgi:hypothetical protein